MIRIRLPQLGLISLSALTVGCGPSSSPSAPPPAQTPSISAAPAPSETAEASAAPAAPVNQTAALADLPPPYNTGDPDNGQAKFALCLACHAIVAGAPDMVGPNLHGVIGRKAGSLAGYIYSDAMKKADWSWDPKHLDTWLANPGQMVEGTKMTFVGLPNAKDRIDVIAYLKTLK